MTRVEIELRSRRAAPISPASPGVPSRTPRPDRRASPAEPPAGGRRDEMRRSGMCEPNLSKSTRASRRRPRAGTPSSGSGALHGASLASTAFRGRCRRSRLAPDQGQRPLTLWVPRSPACLATAAGSLEHQPKLPPGARVNGPGIREDQSAFGRRQAPTSANRRETRARPRATRFPRPPPSLRLATVGHGGHGRRVERRGASRRSRRALERAYGYAEARPTRLRTPAVATHQEHAARSEPLAPGTRQGRHESGRANDPPQGEARVPFRRRNPPRQAAS